MDELLMPSIAEDIAALGIGVFVLVGNRMCHKAQMHLHR